MDIAIRLKPSTKRSEVRAPHKITYHPIPPRIRSEYAARQTQRLDGKTDAEWFDRHPQAAHRVRPISLIERDAYGFDRDVAVIVSLRPGDAHFRQFVSACAIRDPAAPPECFETDGHSFDFLDRVTDSFDPWWFRAS